MPPALQRHKVKLREQEPFQGSSLAPSPVYSQPATEGPTRAKFCGGDPKGAWVWHY